MEGLILRVPVKGSYKRVYKGSIIGVHDVGALKIRIGFGGGFLVTFMVEEYTPNPILIIKAAVESYITNYQTYSLGFLTVVVLQKELKTLS